MAPALDLSSSSLGGQRQTPRFVSYDDFEQAKTVAVRTAHAAQETIERDRQNAATAMHFAYTFKADTRPFYVRSIYDDGMFTYIQMSPRAQEQPALYLVKDGKPELTNYTFLNGVYTVDSVVDRAYLIENYGQLYNSNQSLLQQVEMGIQQYNLLDAQYQRISNIAKYAMSSRNLWATMPFNFNSQGRITGWGTTLDAGTYPSAYSALQQSQYQFNLASAPFLNPDRNNRYALRAASVDLQNNALEDCLATVGNVRNAGLMNEPMLGNLIDDSDDDADALVTSTALEQKTSISTSILAQGQSDANKQLACQLELGTAQLQQAANASAMELQDESDMATTWATGELAGGAGSGSLRSSYTQLQSAAGAVMGVRQ